MTRRIHTFRDAPLTRDVEGTACSLQIVEAVTGEGGTRAVVLTYNGKPGPIHSDRLLMESEVARKRYAKAVAEADPAIEAGPVARALMGISVDLGDRLARDVSGGPEADVAVDTDALWSLAGGLLEAPDLLDRAVGAMESHGLVGETQNAKLLYLAATARLLPKPISPFVKGASSSGKSHLLERVVDLLPPDAYVNFTTVSPRFLAYSTHDLRHKIVLIYEAGGMDDGIGAYVMRSLLSEGCLRIGTVDRGEDDGMEAREIVKEGPTALFTSTTRSMLDGELETRALSLTTHDGPDQSRAIMRGAARRYTGDAPIPADLGPFHALQRWLEHAGERRVVIPFAPKLAEVVPTMAMRIRRDFGKLLTLIAASAVLHQARRERGAGGAIVAGMEDYALVRDLLGEVFAAAQQDGLTTKQREAVRAVADLQPGDTAGVSLVKSPS